MINYILVSLSSCAVSIFICWKFLIPREVDNIYEATRKLLRLYHSDEVEPIQDLLKQYPDIVAEIHEDISKLEYDIDLLSSEGQVSIGVQSNSVKINNVPQSEELINSIPKH